MGLGGDSKEAVAQWWYSQCTRLCEEDCWFEIHFQLGLLWLKILMNTLKILTSQWHKK